VTSFVNVHDDESLLTHIGRSNQSQDVGISSEPSSGGLEILFRQVKHKTIHISFIHFHDRFSSGERRGCSSPRRAWNTSRSTSISSNSADSTPRLDQVPSKM